MDDVIVNCRNKECTCWSNNQNILVTTFVMGVSALGGKLPAIKSGPTKIYHPHSTQLSWWRRESPRQACFCSRLLPTTHLDANIHPSRRGAPNETRVTHPQCPSPSVRPSQSTWWIHGRTEPSSARSRSRSRSPHPPTSFCYPMPWFLAASFFSFFISEKGATCFFSTHYSTVLCSLLHCSV